MTSLNNEFAWRYLPICTLGVPSRPRKFLASVFAWESPWESPYPRQPCCLVCRRAQHQRTTWWSKQHAALFGNEENFICDVNNDNNEKCATAMAVRRHRRGVIVSGKDEKDKYISSQKWEKRLAAETSKPCESCTCGVKCNCSCIITAR